MSNFWKMICDRKSAVVVMLSDLVEGGKEASVAVGYICMGSTVLNCWERSHWRDLLLGISVSWMPR